MSEKILLVDDEIAILQGYQRLLHREFNTSIALGGACALAEIERSGPFAVVVSDMRMPDMDGAQLLAKVRISAPDTVRVMLTGNADMQTAVRAVNDGNIFRFLTKPCTKDTLAKTLTASLVQHRLQTAEKELLENTLQGTIAVLTDVLSLVNPAAFSRAVRIRRYIRHIAAKLAWRTGSSWLRSTNATFGWPGSPRPLAATRCSTLRRWPGPSATTISLAPLRRHSSIAAATTLGCVLITLSR